VGDLTWWLGVRYTYDHATGAVSADQEAFVDNLLDQYAMSNCNPCVLPIGRCRRPRLSAAARCAWQGYRRSVC
jgi:hypothetical protein